MPIEEEKCESCESATEPLSGEEACKLAADTPKWNVGKISMEREFLHDNFLRAVEFVNKVAEIAEGENHHPDILIHGYKKVKIELTTHSVGGLSKNDFILAVKIDKIS